MSEFLFVKLAEGRRVRDPLSLAVMLPGKVYRVVNGQFWLRRLDAGDLVLEKESESKEHAAEKVAEAPKKKSAKAGD